MKEFELKKPDGGQMTDADLRERVRRLLLAGLVARRDRDKPAVDAVVDLVRLLVEAIGERKEVKL